MSAAACCAAYSAARWGSRLVVDHQRGGCAAGANAIGSGDDVVVIEEQGGLTVQLALQIAGRVVLWISALPSTSVCTCPARGQHRTTCRVVSRRAR